MATTGWGYRLRRGLAYATLPWFRLELPGWRRLCAPLGLSIGHEAMWSGLPVFACRGKLHGYRMDLRMEDWCDRLTYFLGRYYDLGLQTLLQTALRPGDTFVDIGANIGMITLMAARCVGPKGRIIAFEPHPGNAERLRQTLERNRMTNITLLPVGLADREGTLPLQMVAQSSGWATFIRRPEAEGLTYDTLNVPVRRADDALPEDLGPRTFIKIDAEGFECRILDGMRDHLRRHPAVVTELESELLRIAGSSVDDLCRRMTQAGYSPFFYGVRGGWRGRRRLLLRPAKIEATPAGTRDVLWLHPQSPYKDQLREALS